MHHGIKTLSLFFTFILLIGCSRSPISSQRGRLYTVAFYNSEEFFDTNNDPQTADDAYTPTGAKQWTQERYNNKMENIASVIASIGGKGGPAIVGLAEVENKQVVEELVNTPLLKKFDYGIVHHDMPDNQGMDVALIYQPKHFKPTFTKSIPINFGANYNSRDILQVKGELRGELVTIYVTHWPPRSRTKAGKQDDSRLRSAAKTLRQQIDQQQAADENAKIIILGDFNTEPDAAVLKQVLQATGRPDPSYEEELFNTHYLPFVNGFGSYASQGNLQMLDQILVSKALLNDEAGLQYVRGSAGIYNPDFIKHMFGKYRGTPNRTFSGNLYLGGYSDHFPVYIQLRRKR
ncbi:endonuclease/exonuclease/phosphatase family protein [Pontibacter pamirensis]|uniref:endonuclease/exonuclease/phosphatase family protein n=1 Tax=Pontibacter pamirensis TaxID=2562824 RepID=UPI001389CDB3|nr:endonuclease/exonuclease/phosphatase family protein [Pontibacter pamirensis]